MKSVTILGVTGSIGQSALRFLRLHRDKFSLDHISVGCNAEQAVAIAREFNCQSLGVADEACDIDLPDGVKLYRGAQALCEQAAQPVDVVLGAVSGSQGLPAILAAINAGNRVALANKESLVCGGTALLERARAKGVPIIPVDSEHSAMFQCLLAGKREEVHSIILTASGGPFREHSLEQLKSATAKAALNHPNWSMGPKNSLDSATLANKGLELIETCYFFDMAPEDVTVVIHPTSIFHSAVQYCDGSVIAQLGETDMAGAIGYGLSYPDRIETGLNPLDLTALGGLDFYPYDSVRFPAVDLARRAIHLGQSGTLMFNAANEIAGQAFLDGRIGFLDIARHIETALNKGGTKFKAGLDDIVRADAEAKSWCEDWIH
ncbi:1-deoxy-D-xylulose-5-phosphate reductoisomerase [Robiginitomaculum antarcticum]|uniref:1-deoxy-D-xylulose-5-phosphate reductoisomerase n=1 Tax=Robiginitomaculum antarcticum TaxID=437507 RepID=UPI00036D792E|nr:1-deoxy-D-xylulose-5-phosphate reductoisomerase [Robiginitomaculum antarcticum]